MQAEDLDWVAEAEQAIYPFPWSRANFADSLDAGYSSWVMQREKAALGYAVLMQVVDEAHLLNISIMPALQGRGLGSQLLEHLCVVAQRFGARQMYLEVRDSNVAGQRLYDKWNFERVGRRKAYYPAPNGREDAIVMRRELNAQGNSPGGEL
jgi:ribosomal-protein-alanine N-acetyltransferase